MGMSPVVITYSHTFAALFWALGIVRTCHHLTQPASLASLNLSTDSMSLYGHAAGTTVESGFNSRKSQTTLPIYIVHINLCLESKLCALYAKKWGFKCFCPSYFTENTKKHFFIETRDEKNTKKLIIKW